MLNSNREVFSVEIPQFKTHVKQSSAKWVKINGQTIYTSAHHRVRYMFMEQIHEYLLQYIPKFDENITTIPLELTLYIYAPINYGDVRRMKGVINWKPAKEDYKPSWDLDNFAWIWVKGVQDVLQKQGIIPDDNVKFIRKVSYEYIPVEQFDDRKLVITLSQSETSWTRFWSKLFKLNTNAK
jgi:hypothetical protein